MTKKCSQNSSTAQLALLKLIVPRNLSNEADIDDRKWDVAKKQMKLPFSNFISSIWTPSVYQMQATFPGVEFLRTSSRFKKIKENLLSDVYVLHKTLKFL